MASATQTVPPSLSLPPSQFARLQPHAFLLAHLAPPASSSYDQSGQQQRQRSIRANGREPSQFRTVSANAGSLTHTHGSAVVRIGDTAAVCGVRAEILHTNDIASWSVSSLSSSPARISREKRRRLEVGEPRVSGEEAERKEDNDQDDDDDDNDGEDELQIQKLNLLVPNLSLSTGCAPGFTPGAPPSALAQSLSQQLLTLLHSSRLVRAEDLRIWGEATDMSDEDLMRAVLDDSAMETDQDRGRPPATLRAARRELKAFWVLYIDVMLISLAGNAFDAAWAAVLAALRDTKLPMAWWDTDNAMVFCSDSLAKARPLSLRGFPVASSYCVFEADAAAAWRAVVVPDADELTARRQELWSRQRWLLADPDAYEESLCQEKVCLVVDKTRAGQGKTVILKMEKNGGWTVGKEELRQLVDLSTRRWAQVKSAIC